MLTFEDVKITEDVVAKPFDHTPTDELHVKVFVSDPIKEVIYKPLMRIGQGRAEVNVGGVMHDLVKLVNSEQVQSKARTDDTDY